MSNFKSFPHYMSQYCWHLAETTRQLKEDPGANVDSLCFVGVRYLMKLHKNREVMRTRQLKKINDRATVLLRAFKYRDVHKKISQALADIKEELSTRPGVYTRRRLAR